MQSKRVMHDEMQRVVVVGSSGSGKTTFAARLAESLGVVHVELDALYWGPNWTSVANDVFRERVEKATSRSGWVVDGNYLPIHDVFWHKATVLVWLDYSLLTVFSRSFRRSIRRIVYREQLFSCNREPFRQTFLSCESILWWVISTYRQRRQELGALLQSSDGEHLEVYRFKRPSESTAFLETIDGKRATPVL